MHKMGETPVRFALQTDIIKGVNFCGFGCSK